MSWSLNESHDVNEDGTISGERRKSDQSIDTSISYHVYSIRVDYYLISFEVAMIKNSSLTVVQLSFNVLSLWKENI